MRSLRLVVRRWVLWATVEVSSYGDLTPYELSKELVRRAEAIAPVISTAAVEKDRRGRKAAHGSPKGEIAAALGTGTTTLVRAEQHVEAAAKYPELAVEWIMLSLTMHLGPHDVLLNLEIKFREELSAAEIGAAVDRIEQHLRRRDPAIKRIFIEAESLSPAGRQKSPRRLE